jgi:hypothetical protein
LRPKTTEQLRRKTEQVFTDYGIVIQTEISIVTQIRQVFLGCVMSHKIETRMSHKSERVLGNAVCCSKMKLGH